MTITSLTGSYVYVVIQVTRDLHPVVYDKWRLMDVDLDVGVADVTLAQFKALALRAGRQPDTANIALQDWPKVISHSMLSLTHLLKVCVV